MNEVKQIKVIYCTKATRGDGKEYPIRRIVEIFDLRGKLLAEEDPNGNFTAEEMISFANYCKVRNDYSIDNLRNWVMSIQGK